MYKRDDSWRRDWESKARVDGTANREDAPTIVGKTVQPAPATTVVRWQHGDHSRANQCQGTIGNCAKIRVSNQRAGLRSVGAGEESRQS
jgi:hypothetical protein